MTEGLLLASGGLGLFLLGMSVLTEGLRAMADERLRAFLATATRGPVWGVWTGAVATALIRSSSATTVAAVGFVHAGLLTFPQALGIVFGANIGTTTTGWIVAILGFKLNLGHIVLPALLAGTLMRILGQGRQRHIGTAVAGFSLIFVGIQLLQDGMSGLQTLITPDLFPADTIPGRFLCVLLGAVITVITQSSSAGVAMALTAVHAGALPLQQAAAMVIGMDFGTTMTAALATIGGNLQARRTGMAHVVFNAMTAAGAFLLLTPYMLLAEWLLPATVVSDPELVLVGFHTVFNALGVLLVLPFTNQFARLIMALFPEGERSLTRRLDPSLLQQPEFALPAFTATLQHLTHVIFESLARRLEGIRSDQTPDVSEIRSALEETRTFLERIRIDSLQSAAAQQYLDGLHILDHLQRVVVRMQRESRLAGVDADPGIRSMKQLLLEAIRLLLQQIQSGTAHSPTELRRINAAIKQAQQQYRRATLQQAASHQIDARTALARLDTARWLRRLVQHALRVSIHGVGFSNAVSP